MNLPNITTAPCPFPTAIPAGTCGSSQCLDPVFAAANPDLCGANPPRIVLKPETGLICAGNTLQFLTFLQTNGAEVQIMAGLTYTTSNPSSLGINAVNGSATGLAAGVVTVGVTWEGISAFAQITVMGGTNCCDSVVVGMFLALDDSKSMSQAFDGTHGSKLDMAKALASRFASELIEAKDYLGYEAFDIALGNETVPAFGQDDDTVLALIAATSQTQNLTDMGLPADGVAKLLASPKAINVLVIFSDGTDTSGSPSLTANLAVINNFRNAGGIVLVVGIRASGTGYTLLMSLASGGFFLNAIPDNADSIGDLLSGLKGYFCAGACNVSGILGYGIGCLQNPPPSQLPDPNPLPEIELGGVTPPLYSSTKTVTLTCPAGTGQAATTSVPKMTGPSTPSGVVTESNHFTGFEGWKAFGSVGWIATGGTGWLDYAFPVAKTILGYALTTAGMAVPPFGYSYVLAGSNDGVTYTSLATSAGEISTGATAYRTIATPGSYRHYRLSFTLFSGSNFALRLLELFEDSANNTGVTRSATATSNVSQADADQQATQAATLLCQSALICYGNAVSILDLHTATPFPAAYRVSGFGGTVAKIQVSVKMTHQWPSDVTLVLVNPYGTAVRLMAGCGNGHPINNVVFLFDDSGATMSASSQLVAGTFAPSTHNTHIPPAPCPQSPGAVLSVYNGVNPNGVWLLYVDDNKGLDAGQIAQWSVIPS